jgi:hypothetical protein
MILKLMDRIVDENELQHFACIASPRLAYSGPSISTGESLVSIKVDAHHPTAVVKNDSHSRLTATMHFTQMRIIRSADSQNRDVSYG